MSLTIGTNRQLGHAEVHVRRGLGDAAQPERAIDMQTNLAVEEGVGSAIEEGVVTRLVDKLEI